jgi:hypothetical protein
MSARKLDDLRPVPEAHGARLGGSLEAVRAWHVLCVRPTTTTVDARLEHACEHHDGGGWSSRARARTNVALIVDDARAAKASLRRFIVFYSSEHILCRLQRQNFYHGASFGCP